MGANRQLALVVGVSAVICGVVYALRGWRDGVESIIPPIALVIVLAVAATHPASYKLTFRSRLACALLFSCGVAMTLAGFYLSAVRLSLAGAAIVFTAAYAADWLGSRATRPS